MRLFKWRRDSAEFVRACSVFVHRERAAPVLVAAVYNHAGLFSEKPGEVGSVPDGDLAALGQQVQFAMTRCTFEPEFNHSTNKLTDWPAFRASGLRTVKRFEREYVRLHVRGANEKNITYAVAGPELGPYGIHVAASVSASAPPEVVGAAIIEVWDQHRRVATSCHQP